MKSLKKLLEKESQKFPFLALSSSGTRRMTTQSLLCGSRLLELFVQFVCIITETFPEKETFLYSLQTREGSQTWSAGCRKLPVTVHTN